MVYAKFEDIYKYIDKDVYEKIENFLNSIYEDMPEGMYEISGSRIYARVMSYETSPAEVCKIEAHNKYIDIQATILGAEGISVFDRSKLIESQTYDEQNDVVFYCEKPDMAKGHCDNIPGYFTLLYPEDAHRPQEKILGIDKVKKFVIKIAVA